MMNSMAQPQGSTSRGSESTAQILKNYLEATSPAARNAALGELIAVKRPEAVAPLISALMGEDRTRRAAAAEALGKMGALEAVGPLVESLSVPDVNLRLKAISALGLIGDMKAAEPLIPFLRDPMPAARMLAAEALGRVASQSAVEPLIDAMNHSHAEMRRHMTSAQDNRVRSLAATSRAQADEEWVFQWAIATALAGIGHPKGGSAIFSWASRIFTSDVRRISAEDKGKLVRDVCELFFRKQDKNELYSLLNRLQAQIKIQSWQRLSNVTETYDWIDASRPNPIWQALQDELASRTAAVVSLPIGGADPRDTSVGGPIGAGRVTAAAVPYFAPVSPEPAPQMIPVATPSPSPTAPSTSPAPKAPSLTADGIGPTPAQAKSSGLDATLDELMSLMGATPKPRDTPIPQAAAPKIRDRIPAPDPRVAELLDLLKANGVRNLVVVGGAVRDAVAGRKPRDLDLALLAPVSEEAKGALALPEVWNGHFVKLALEAIQKLAGLVSCSMTDLICGRAVFKAKSGLIPVHYVGPYVLDRTERRRTRESAETVVRHVYSRWGIVADEASGRLWSALPTVTVSDMWLDCEQNSRGGFSRGLVDLAEATLELSGDHNGEEIGWTEFAHLLGLKLELGGEPGPQMRRVMESAARLIKQDQTARGEFDSADLERFRQAVGGEPEAADEAVRRELHQWGLKEFAFGP